MRTRIAVTRLVPLFAGGLIAAVLGLVSTVPAQAKSTARGSSAAWCRASASYNRRDRDYNVYVHSNQPHRDARVKNSNGRELFGYPTNGEGYADVYLYGRALAEGFRAGAAGQKVIVEVGRARCYTHL
jgi:cold shock CspA family protein